MSAIAQVKNLTFTLSTKKLGAKLSFEKAARKMLVKSRRGRFSPPPPRSPTSFKTLKKCR
jgi:hypothetical protein